MELARSLIALSLSKTEQAKYRDADDFARQALAILNGKGGAGQNDLAAAEIALGRAVLINRDFHQAQRLLEDALNRQQLGRRRKVS